VNVAASRVGQTFDSSMPLPPYTVVDAALQRVARATTGASPRSPTWSTITTSTSARLSAQEKADLIEFLKSI
jgi:hypothetical protein